MINVLLFPFDLILNEVEGVKQASISVLDFFGDFAETIEWKMILPSSKGRNHHSNTNGRIPLQ